MGPSLPLLGLPFSGAWKKAGAEIDHVRVDNYDLEAELDKVVSALVQDRGATILDPYIIIGALYNFAKTNKPVSDEHTAAVRAVLWSLSEHVDRAQNDAESEPWSWWGGPPDDDRWWAHLWEERDEWEAKRNEYRRDHRRDYGRLYKSWHFQNMLRRFGAYHFREEEALDRLRVGKRTLNLVHQILAHDEFQKLLGKPDIQAELMFTADFLNLGTETLQRYGIAHGVMSERAKELQAYTNSTLKLSELTVFGQHVWKRYDVPKHRDARMLLLVVYRANV